MTMLAEAIDKGMKALERLTHRLGEGPGVATPTYKKAKLASQSITLDVPSIANLMPFETTDEDLMFINKQSMGFGFKVLPMSGADETLVKALSNLLKNKLPVDVDCTVMLYRHHRIKERLDDGFDAMESQGGIFEGLADLSKSYHAKAAIDGYPNGRNIAAKLSDYEAYLFFSKRGFEKDFLMNLRTEIESELNVSGFCYARLQRLEFLKLMRMLLAPNLNSIVKPEIDDMVLPLSHLVPEGNSLFTIHDAGIDIDGSDKEGTPFQTRIINCEINKWGDSLALWQTPDIYANMLEPQHGIPCSFLISMTVRGVSQERMLQKAKMRAKSLNANANAIQLFLNPSVKDEQADWNYIHEEGSRDNLALLPLFYNVTLFTHPEDEQTVVAKTISSYRQLGFELQQSRSTQWVRFLASLPFFMTEGFFKDFATFGLIKTLTHHNIANLMPLVGSHKGSSQGLLLPTHRHQLAYLDTFDNKSLPITNFNFLTVGSSGAGKSMFQQAQILSGLALGEVTYVIDLGHSYKHLCELVGGTYIDVSNITLNPFTLFDFEGKTELQDPDGRLNEVADNIQIRDLLALMASPHEPINDVQKAYLLDAALWCWKKKGRASTMDDVLDALRSFVDDTKEDTRLGDLIILLKKYGSRGLYGHLFNGTTPLIQNKGLVVFEMGGFQNNPELLSIVMFVMIVIIQGQFYQTDRRIKKRCIIDEAWRFLCDGSNPIAAQFIEQGFRTARKHNGGFGVITQYLLDTEKTIQGQAIAASSDIKIIMRQGNFKEYVRAYPNRFTPYQQRMIESFGDVVGSGFSNLMIEAGNTYSFHRYFADPFTRVLFSSSGEEFGAIEALMQQGVSLMDAIQEVVCQKE
jgi:conjugal transfer ATP-binding protein TraC